MIFPHGISCCHVPVNRALAFSDCRGIVFCLEDMLLLANPPSVAEFPCVCHHGNTMVIALFAEIFPMCNITSVEFVSWDGIIELNVRK